MWTSIIVAIIAATPPSIIGWLNSRKADAIHVLVNSNLTEVKTELALANQQIKDLQTFITKQYPGATVKL